jgi:hypothetical protein
MTTPMRIWGAADDGAVIEVEVSGDADPRLDDRWPPIGLTRASSPPGTVERRLAVEQGVRGGGILVRVEGEPSPGGWSRLESELTFFAAEHLSHQVAVHAGVLRHRGRAILLPGASHSGKSSLCVAAASLGVDVLTDEYALIDPGTGRTTGWPRPVRRRTPDGGVQRLDLVVGSGPLSVAAVAVLRFDHAARGWGRPVSPARAVLGILENTVCARTRPGAALDAACAIARSCDVALEGPRGEAVTTVEALTRLLDDVSA